MAFDGYRGQCIGRLMSFLYGMNTLFDHAQFGDGVCSQCKRSKDFKEMLARELL